jgi:hypothetical protein
LVRFCFLPRPAWTLDHGPIYSSCSSWDDKWAPPHPAIGCPGWPQTMIPFISASQVSRITGMSHYTWLLSHNF